MQRWQAAVPDHHQPRLDGLHAVAQHRATLLGVEHAGDCAELGHRRHAGQQGGTVLEQQADRVARAHPVSLQHMCNAVGPGVEVAVAPALAFEQQAVLVGDVLGLVFQYRTDRLALSGVSV
jgi:hypothetical protein